MNDAKTNRSIQVSKETISKMMDFYNDQKIESKNPYIILFAKTETCAISIYTTNKVLFQGDGADVEAGIWLNVEEAGNTKASMAHSSQTKTGQTKTNQANTSKSKPSLPAPSFIEHAGSDEVGTGDYFGPICVCACMITSDAYQAIQHLGIDDSKKLDDALIRRIAPLIKEVVPYSLLVLPNRKYNEIHAKYNMNGIKAMLHNQAYVHLKNKVEYLPALCVIDQFTPERSYYQYLKYEQTIFRSLHFETKAESKYLAVACASIIAREAFLLAMDQLSEAYDMTLPKGAGTLVDKAIKAFIEKHGFDSLRNVAKLHFANTNKVISE